MLNLGGDEISRLPYATETLKVHFIIDVLRAALLLLSIIHLLSTKTLPSSPVKPDLQRKEQNFSLNLASKGELKTHQTGHSGLINYE